VQAAPVSSFAGIGPGWAREDCRDGGASELVLFAEVTGPRRSVVINPAGVDVLPAGISSIKARFR
jgi:hypothetical protein